MSKRLIMLVFKIEKKNRFLDLDLFVFRMVLVFFFLLFFIFGTFLEG